MRSYRPTNPKAPYIWHGGDYNPEQWPEATWDDDAALMQQAHYKIATIGVFSWVSLQPAEDTFTFEWLDRVIEKLSNADRTICLATPSAAIPAWMAKQYPDVLRADARGRRVHHGGRTNYCPSSPTYRRLAMQMATKLAERYKDLPNLMLWHISNEYATPCYCDTCAAAFRSWLQNKYGTLDALNDAWWTRFWSHTFTDWEQVDPYYEDGETRLHGLTIDYRRFQSDAMLACYQLERDAIRAITPDIPITTNMMGTFPHLDYRAWAKEVDVVSWDCYPAPSGYTGDIGFLHDLNRGLKDGQPFLMLEQTPSSQNWQTVNALKRPGVMRLWSYMALAHGSDSVMYFQWRRGRGGCEKFHGAVVEHSGRSDTRVFREVSELGAELERLGDLTIGAVTHSKVAVLFDWNNWWAIENAVGPINPKDYVAFVRKHYGALWRKNVSVDIIFSDSALDQYEIVIAPMLYMVKPGVGERIQAFVERGGTFVSTVFSGIANETDLAFEGYPGPLSKTLGIWVEEIDALYPNQANQIVLADGSGSYACGMLCDIVHAEGAEVLATYGHDFYEGMPVVTRNRLGAGQGYYIGTDADEMFLDRLYGDLLAEKGIQPLLEAPFGVEVTQRENDQHRVLFVLNHNSEPTSLDLPEGNRYHDYLSESEVSGSLELPAYGVAILEAR
ncbi:beta-galactosidase [Chloroflexia bacterium SDU3-3]|nr:beta-galactosidase [Chloroflexia bacterium SDU3-3]